MSRRGSNNANWRGGRRRGGEGQRYWLVYTPDHPNAVQGAVLEHRLVMEATLGRHLSESEIVHHRNGDTLDNRPENLEVMTQAEHARLHYSPLTLFYRRPPAERIPKTCDYCHVFFLAVGKKEAAKRFCSRDCYWCYRREFGGLLQAGVPA